MSVFYIYANAVVLTRGALVVWKHTADIRSAIIGEDVRGKTGTFQKRRNDSVLQTGRSSATRV